MSQHTAHWWREGGRSKRRRRKSVRASHSGKGEEGGKGYFFALTICGQPQARAKKEARPQRLSQLRMCNKRMRVSRVRGSPPEGADWQMFTEIFLFTLVFNRQSFPNKIALNCASELTLNSLLWLLYKLIVWDQSRESVRHKSSSSDTREGKGGRVEPNQSEHFPRVGVLLWHNYSALAWWVTMIRNGVRVN